MTDPPPSSALRRARTAALVTGLVLLRLALDLRLLAADPQRFVDWEEAWNVTVGRVVLATGDWSLLLPLQNKVFCGGCSVVGVLGGGAVGLGGDQLLAWKAVALGWTAATLVAAWFFLDRVAGRGAAWAGLLLLALPPRGVQELALMRWGNHDESMLLVLLTLLVAVSGRSAGTAALTGLLGGLSLWFCRTSAFGVGLALLWVLGRGRRRHRFALALGLVAGLLPLGLDQAGGEVGPYDLSAPGLFIDSPADLLPRVAALLSPAQLAHRLYPGPGGGPSPGLVLLTGLVLVAAGLAGLRLLARARRQRDLAPALPLLLLLAFALAFCLVDLPLLPAVDGGPVKDARYHAPWLVLLLLVTASGAAARPRAGLLLLLPALLAGLVSQPRHLRHADLLRTLPATDAATFARVAAERLPPDALPAPERADAPDVQPLLAHTRGIALGLSLAASGEDWRATARDASLEVCVGLGQGLVDHPWTEAELARANRRLAELEPARAQALGRGMGLNLGFDLPRRAGEDPRDQLRLLRTGLSGEGPSDQAPMWLASALARPQLGRCRRESRGAPQPLTACLSSVAALAARHGAEVELAWGLGVASAGAPEPEQQALAAVLSQPEARAAYEAGRQARVLHGERAVRADALRRDQERGAAGRR